MYYTYGQRKGLGIGGMKDSNETPWYVSGKNLKSNELIVVQGQDDPHLYHQILECSQLHWIAGVPPNTHSLTAKIRYRQADQECEISVLNNQKLRVTFKQPQRAITPGQSIVFYLDEVCLGGAIIETMYNQDDPL